MSILGAAKPAIVICTKDRARSTSFYRDTLGLTLAYEDDFAAVFNTAESLCASHSWPISRRMSTPSSASMCPM